MYDGAQGKSLDIIDKVQYSSTDDCKCPNCTKISIEFTNSFRVNWNGRIKYYATLGNETLLGGEIVRILCYVISPHGHGECTWTNSEGEIIARFIGEFENRCPIRGKLVYSDGISYFDGTFDNGYETCGTFCDKDGKSLVTEGLTAAHQIKFSNDLGTAPTINK